MVKDFEAKLSEYAHLLVEVGLNVQPGQTPSIESNIEYAALTRLCVAAYIWKLYHIKSQNTIPFDFFSGRMYNSANLVE